MKAVCTILGWCIAGAAAAGADTGADRLVEICDSGFGGLAGDEGKTSAWPLGSASGLFVAEAGADGLVGVVSSIGSPGDGADI